MSPLPTNPESSAPTSKRRLWFALIAGAAIEALWFGWMAIAEGQVGPCGPDSLMGFLFLIWHVPAFSIAMLLPDSSWIYIPILFVSGALSWTVVVLVVTALGKTLFADVAKRAT